MCYLLSHMNVSHWQLVFRKVADVKREKELAEKRKNDPPLELASDHPVRKLISRFRRMSDRNQNVDPEAGGRGKDGGDAGLTPNNIATTNHTLSAHTTMINESPADEPNSKSKWNTFLAGAAAASPSSFVGAGDDNKLMPVPPKTTTAVGAIPLKTVQPQTSAHKPASRWGKMFAKQPETIVEKDEETSSSAATGATGGHASDSYLRESLTDEAALTQRDIAVAEIGHSSLTPAEQNLVQCLCDIKMDMKNDISVLNEKMTKMEDQIGSILKMFTAASSLPPPQSPCSLSSRFTTTSSFGNGGSVKSPKPSSPPCAYSDDARQTVSDNNACRTITPPSPSSVTDKSSSGSGTDASGTAKRTPRRKKGSTTNRKRVAPSDDNQTVNVGEVAPRTGGNKDDEDQLPIKDRDLDIL